MTKLPVCKAAVALMCSAMLVACGGGSDDDTPADPIDKYVGTWRGACLANGAGKWMTAKYVFTKAGATSATGALNLSAYGNSTCEGKPLGGETVEYASAVMAGATTASGRTAERFVLTNAQGKTGKTLFSAEADEFFSSQGATFSLDADGFPTALNLDYPYHKQ